MEEALRPTDVGLPPGHVELPPTDVAKPIMDVGWTQIDVGLRPTDVGLSSGDVHLLENKKGWSDNYIGLWRYRKASSDNCVQNGELGVVSAV